MFKKEADQYIIIGGVYKGGTTSLYTYLAMHDLVCGSTKKETEYFNKDSVSLPDYRRYFTSCSQGQNFLEASPGYLYGGQEVNKRIRSILGTVKIIFILRDPVERFLSDYRHMVKTMHLPKGTSISEYFQIMKNGQNGEFPNSLEQGEYVYFLKDWLDGNDEDVKVIFFEDLTSKTLETVVSLCDWLGIPSDPYLEVQFGIENKSVQYKNKMAHSLAYFVFNKFESFFRRNYKIKSRLRAIYFSLNTKEFDNGKGQKERKMLEGYYDKSIRDLRHLLLSRGYENLPGWMQVPD